MRVPQLKDCKRHLKLDKVDKKTGVPEGSDTMIFLTEGVSAGRPHRRTERLALGVRLHHLEKQWVEQLRRKYPVTVNEAVVDTVK